MTNFVVLEERHGRRTNYPKTEQLPVLARALKLEFESMLPHRIARVDERATDFGKIERRFAVEGFCHVVNTSRPDGLQLMPLLDNNRVRPSVQTAPDQYLDACWGLWTYQRIATEAEQRRIRQMFIAFADHWRSVDYVLSYFGSRWDLKGETGAYNAIFAMINACAYSLSKSPVYLQEFEKWMAKATWPQTTALETLRQNVLRQVQEKGKADVVPYSAAFSLAKDVLKPGECLCWETIIHSKFVAVAADLIVQSKASDLSGQLAAILERWWREWKYGMGEEWLAYYWFAVDLVNDTWRPLPSTQLLPKEQWRLGRVLSKGTGGRRGRSRTAAGGRREVHSKGD